MAWVHRTMIVPATHRAMAQTICSTLAGPAGEGMFTTELSASGKSPATHYVSAGLIDEQFAYLMSDGSALHSICQQSGIAYTLEELRDLLAVSAVYEGDPHGVISLRGMKTVQKENADDPA